MTRVAIVLAILLTACGTRQAADGGDDDAHDASVATDTASGDGGTATDASGVVDAPPIDASPIDAFPAVLDVRINCRNDCVLVADPPAIAVPAGTAFEVNWINVGDTECDVAKVDQFNQVPIIIGLEPGTSIHDSVHEWCGPQFTDTFRFRISICTLHSFIPVDCGA